MTVLMACSNGKFQQMVQFEEAGHKEVPAPI